MLPFLTPRLVLLIYSLLVVVFSLIPGRDVSIRYVDKITHFLGYAGLAILALLSFQRLIPRLLALIGAVGLGALLEWGQSFVPGRDMSLLDGVANSLGVLAGALIFLFLEAKIQEFSG